MLLRYKNSRHAVSDPWGESTFDGKERGQRQRVAALTAEQRLRWLEDELREAERSGVLQRIRARKQEETLAAWTPPGP